MNKIIVNIKRLINNNGIKTYLDIGTNKDLLIYPVDIATLSIYPDLPLNKAFNFLIKGTEVKQGDKFIIVDKGNFNILNNNDSLVIYDNPTLINAFNSVIYSGICFKE